MLHASYILLPLSYTAIYCVPSCWSYAVTCNCAVTTLWWLLYELIDSNNMTKNIYFFANNTYTRPALLLIYYLAFVTSIANITKTTNIIVAELPSFIFSCALMTWLFDCRGTSLTRFTRWSLVRRSLSQELLVSKTFSINTVDRARPIILCIVWLMVDETQHPTTII